MPCPECVRLTAERDRRHRAFLRVQKLFDYADHHPPNERQLELRTAVQDALMELNFAQTELTHHRDQHGAEASHA